MSRAWFAVQTAMFRGLKFRRLSEDAQLTLFYIWALAGEVRPEAGWPSRQDLGELLQLSGRPRDSLDELMRQGWLDEDAAGCITVHDWDEWQRAASVEALREWERGRKRAWRLRATHSPRGLSLPIEQPRTVQNSGTGLVRDMPLTDVWPGAWSPFLAQWDRRFDQRPTPEQRAVLWEVVDARPSNAADWLGQAPKGCSPYEAVGCVLDSWHGLQATLPSEPAPPHRAELPAAWVALGETLRQVTPSPGTGS